MTRLLEWQVRNNNNNQSTASTVAIMPSSNTGSYKNKLKKLFDYHINKTRKISGTDASLNTEYSNMKIEDLYETGDEVGIVYSEHEFSKDSNINRDRKHKAVYNKNSKSWLYSFCFDDRVVTRKEGVGFNNLISIILPRIHCPLASDTLWQEIKESTDLSIAEEFKEFETMWESIASVNDNNFIKDERAEIKPVYITNILGQKVNLSNPEEFETEVARQVTSYKEQLLKSLENELTRKYRLKEIKKQFAGNQDEWFKAKVEYFESTLRNNFNLTVEREQ